MDDSFHGWLEKGGSKGCLINMVDDATNVSWGRSRRFGRWPTRCEHGSSTTGLRGEEPITPFGRMSAKLGIAISAASSPQAKGRVERSHGTHQDRLVKKLRRKEISSYAVANVYLEREYLPEHNRRFARAAARAENYHRRVPRREGLDKIFRLETEHTVSEDGVVRYRNRLFQIARTESELCAVA
jgi:hypothetical protein